MSDKWVVYKTTEPYEGGPGYSGWTCIWTNTEPGKIYDSKEEAEAVAKRFGDRNRGAEFKVTKWKKPSKYKKPKKIEKTVTTHMDKRDDEEEVFLPIEE